MGAKHTKRNVKEVFAGEEIYLKDLFFIFWERRKIVWILAVVFLLLGVLVSLTATDTFTASSTRISQFSGGGNAKGAKGLSFFPGLTAGGSNSSDNLMDPAMYSKILASDQFMLELMLEEFFIAEAQDTITLYEYIRFYQDEGLINSIIDRISGDKKPKTRRDKILYKLDTGVIQNVERAPLSAAKKVREMINVSTDGSFVKVFTKSATPEFSAEFNRVVFNKLVDYSVRQQTLKERSDLSFLERQAEHAQSAYVESQRNYARYLDSNKGVISATFQIEEQRLKYDMDLNFRLYNDLAVQMADKRLELEENTPVFTVFEPIYIPTEPDETTSITIVLYMAIGLSLGFFIVLALILKDLLS